MSNLDHHDTPPPSQDAEFQSLRESLGLRQLIGESPKFVREIKRIPLIGRYDIPVLITGETGTGKELCARAIHYLSRRSGGPFVAVNCGAMQVELLQNEMFGHEPQAFTGAAGSRPGLIQEADHGTLFLDEIDSLPAQAMLLRFLQEGEFKPLGSSKTKRADVRVIAATNLEVDEALRAHVLREDLYWRLSVMTIALPPLRERRDDVPLLANFFRSKWATRFERDIHGISEEAMRLLMLHDWPGNVRELENTIERSVIFARSSTIEANDLSFSCQPLRQEADMSFNDLRSRFVYHFEETYLRNVLDSSNGNISKVAQASGMSRRTVRRLLEKHRIKG